MQAVSWWFVIVRPKKFVTNYMQKKWQNVLLLFVYLFIYDCREIKNNKTSKNDFLFFYLRTAFNIYHFESNTIQNQSSTFIWPQSYVVVQMSQVENGLIVYTTQDFESMFDHFLTLCMEVLNNNWNVYLFSQNEILRASLVLYTSSLDFIINE